MMIGDVWISPPMIPDLCRRLDVCRKTVRRWMQKGRLPKPVYDLLDITENGNLARIHSDWEGWNIDPREGHLISPNRLTVDTGKIMSIELRYQQIAALQRKIEDLQACGERQDKELRELTELSKTQAARIAELETALAGYTEGTVVAMRSRKPRR